MRCSWVPENDKLYIRYHDEEWGVPVYDDIRIFEFLVLESAQAGLSWKTVLQKRENYRVAFAGFSPEKVATFGEKDIERLTQDAGIIRNRAKITATINNARQFLLVQKQFGTFANYIWEFVDHKPIDNGWKYISQIPATTPLAEKISKDLKSRGFKFLGPTVIYAHMQATGLVNDHTTDCFRYEEIKKV